MKRDSGFPPSVRFMLMLRRTLLGILCLLPLVAWGQDRPAPLADVAARVQLPTGFQATLFAGEPDVVQPISMTFDDRGRLWVVECLSYPQWSEAPQGPDRVTIYEDTDGDGRHDVRKVFFTGGRNVSSIEFGFGGVWLLAAPELIFIPDRDGDDVPDGPAEVKLDGWNFAQVRHNIVNGLTWGPDGWLYGCHGILATSRVGRPGTPDDERVPINCGIWRYHPLRGQVEAVAWGTTNPWGVDWSETGAMFLTNCVIKHAFQVVPGAHFERMYGQDLNPHVYQLLESTADHLHWAGGHWTSSRGAEGAHGDAGGGHAHSGTMIYLGDNWPAEYRNGLMTLNIHGQRINHDRLDLSGSVFTLRHRPDPVHFGDPWFRGITLKYGPDGGVWVADWSDTGECHDAIDIDREHGRIYKLTHGRPRHERVDLARLDDAGLLERLGHVNDWHVRHARRLLQERSAAGKLNPEVVAQLRAQARSAPGVVNALRAAWTLHVIGAGGPDDWQAWLARPEADLRAWSVTLACEARQLPAGWRERLTTVARQDPSPVVRVYLAGALQRLPFDDRWPIIAELMNRSEDAGDAYLPLMNWYAIEPLVAADPARALSLLRPETLPLVRQFVVRRALALAKEGGTERTPSMNDVVRLLDRSETSFQQDILQGLIESLRGRRTAPMPSDWPRVFTALRDSKRPELHDRAMVLAVVFQDERVIESLLSLVDAGQTPTPQRRQAWEWLLTTGRPELQPRLVKLLDNAELRDVALQGLARYPGIETPRAILERYGDLSTAEKTDAIQTLTARVDFARELVAALERGAVPRADVSVLVVRQLHLLKDAELSARLDRAWGTVRPPAQIKVEAKRRYQEQLTPAVLSQADLSRGRQLYAKTCGNCHKLFGEGGSLGPELTGSQRGNLDYLMENVLDPSAIVPRDYQVILFQLSSGRIVQGIVSQETEQAVVVKTLNETLSIALDEIDVREPAKVSMMPEGLFDKLSTDELRDLVAYLAAPRQVPLPSAAGGGE